MPEAILTEGQAVAVPQAETLEMGAQASVTEEPAEEPAAVQPEGAAPEAVELPAEAPALPGPVEETEAPAEPRGKGDALDDLSLAELVDRFQKRVGIPSVEEIAAAPQKEENNADGEVENEQTNEETEAPEQQNRD